DFAASSHEPSRQILIDWVHEWIAAFGQGTGPGWKPELAARRLIRWIAHSIDLLRGRPTEQSHAFFRTLSAHARFLDRRWKSTRPGIERIEALAGMVYARLSLESGMAADDAIRLLGQTAGAMVDAEGAIPSRNPQEVLRMVEILGWSAGIIDAAGKQPDPSHLGALNRLVPSLQALAHADGRLARFHGGRADAPGAVARALDGIALRQVAERRDLALGYLRMTGGEATVLLDAAPPPGTAEAHASALAMEFTSGAHPIVVNAGSGRGFGREAEAAGRTSTAHSGLLIGVLTGPGPDGTLAKTLPDPGGPVSATRTQAEDGVWALGESRAWLAPFGLFHERRLHLGRDGLVLSGEDTVVASTQQDRARLAKAMPADLSNRRFSANFVIHPDARVAPALNGRAALIVLADGTKWMLRTDGQTVEIHPSQYFEAARTHPRATKQVVVMGDILEYWGRITWSLERLAGPEPG
ncbi:MAG: heparinase II/III family protein, partial [Pseudomonadota bacterium]